MSAPTNADLGEQIMRELSAISRSLSKIEQRLQVAERTWITPTEMAQIAGVTPRTLQTYVTTGQITRPAYKREPRGTSFVYRYHRELAMRDLGLL